MYYSDSHEKCIVSDNATEILETMQEYHTSSSSVVSAAILQILTWSNSITGSQRQECSKVKHLFRDQSKFLIKVYIRDWENNIELSLLAYGEKNPGDWNIDDSRIWGLKQFVYGEIVS